MRDLEDSSRSHTIAQTQITTLGMISVMIRMFSTFNEGTKVNFLKRTNFQIFQTPMVQEMIQIYGILPKLEIFQDHPGDNHNHSLNQENNQ